MAGFKSAFFAFPGDPAELKNPIVAAVDQTASNSAVEVRAWPELDIFGAVIPDEVRDGVEKADVLVCDITRPNLNVYYEIGYAIGLGKSLAPVVNASFLNAINEIQKDGFFDVIGYKVYENSADLAAILAELPDKVLTDLYGKALNTHQPLYMLTAFRKTDFITAITAAIKASKVHYRNFDPAEDPRFKIITAISDITASAGVVVPFLEEYVDDHKHHNLRAAFLAGLARGLGREALLIRHQSRDAPPAAADFRDDIIGVRSESEAAEKVADFCNNVLIAAQGIKSPSPRASKTALQRLTLGATAAENEFRTLEDYFVETAEFLRTARGEANIIAGRKGSGKTAIFFMARDNFRKQKNSVVIDLRPESHQLSLFKSELTKILDIGAFDHTIAGFWYFVILTEILLALKKEIQFQSSRRQGRQSDAAEIDAALDRLEISGSGDFTSRINRLGSYVIEEIAAKSKRGETISPDQLTNIVYRGGVADAKRLVVKHAASFENIVFLFDNIDKGWESDGVDELDVRLVRLLLEALEKVRSDMNVARLSFLFVLFLRNDVFELMVSETPDKGKAAVVRIDWTDRVKLKQVIYARLQASVAQKSNNFDDMWKRFFIERVGGKDTFEFFVDHSLMRPRFLIGVIESAIANAINRGHEIVSEDDCTDAVTQHANSILGDFAFEIRDVSGASEEVLLALSGTTSYITKGEVLARFEKARVVAPEKMDQLFEYMLWYGVLGVVNTNSAECYIYDFDYNMKRLKAEIFVIDDEPLFCFNPALHAALKTKRPQRGPSSQ